MNCLRCGIKTEDNRLFCPNCETAMDTQPVSPDAQAVIYPREVPKAEPAPASKLRSTGQDVWNPYRRRCRRLTWAVVLLSLLLIASSVLTFLAATGLIFSKNLLGQNYITMVTETTEAPAQSATTQPLQAVDGTR